MIKEAKDARINRLVLKTRAKTKTVVKQYDYDVGAHEHKSIKFPKPKAFKARIDAVDLGLLEPFMNLVRLISAITDVAPNQASSVSFKLTRGYVLVICAKEFHKALMDMLESLNCLLVNTKDTAQHA